MYSFPVAADRDGWSLPDTVNLPVHETGQLLFAPNGDTLAVLGGTLLQLFLPLSFAFYFTLRRDEHASSVCVWWVGQNLVGISRFMAGTAGLAWPQLGGGPQEWQLLFTQWEVTLFAAQYAQLTRGLGALVMLVSTMWGVCEAMRLSPPRASVQPHYHRLRVR